ncbi:glycosyl transferase family 2 [Salegentibacter salinarum]|uniref:Glycosyl transferase family 2 n=2 Tax=Salegentibacter salinarum TaxID=447422 RepID=A0A2N0U2H0_9FLAO|nr:glycosyl transferase family 2 [Salegentibacter salinarum]SKB76445.1 Glycosyltransferase like family 2 [Salegentibacter salinarum]
MISIIYAHRNRDTERIKISFESLKKQKLQNFEVIFVDYGSEDSLVKELEKLAEVFSFVHFYHLPVPQVLWNKSKALNYGITKASGEYVFIADIDLVFYPETSVVWEELKNPDKFYLFRLGFLDKKESQQLSTKYKFENLNPGRFGNVNGMILTSRESLLRVNGLDEFFHFYGAEDEDLFARLENAGYQKEQSKKEYFYHNWHPSFSGSEDSLLTGNPRVKNIMRINQRHFQRNRELGIIKPLRQQGMGSFISIKKAQALKKPDIKLEIPNILARVEHVLREELQSHKGEVVQVKFSEDDYYTSLKYRLKKSLGKQTQPYISMKEVNDIVLKEILYNYRDHNYSFMLGKDLKSIVFCLEV